MNVRDKDEFIGDFHLNQNLNFTNTSSNITNEVCANFVIS